MSFFAWISTACEREVDLLKPRGEALVPEEESGASQVKVKNFFTTGNVYLKARTRKGLDKPERKRGFIHPLRPESPSLSQTLKLGTDGTWEKQRRFLVMLRLVRLGRGLSGLVVIPSISSRR
jgi:hypothetical protein